MKMSIFYISKFSFPFLLVSLLQIGLIGLTCFPLLKGHTGLWYETKRQHLRSWKRQHFEPCAAQAPKVIHGRINFNCISVYCWHHWGAGADVTGRQAGGARGIVGHSFCPYPAPTAASSTPCLCPLPGEGSFVRSCVQGTNPGQTGRRE